MTAAFYLTVQQAVDGCSFKLSWGRGQRLTARLQDADALRSVLQSYQQWQSAYLTHYSSNSIAPPSEDDNQLRGKLKSSGSVAVPGDTHSELVKAEYQLLDEFNHWLRHSSLYEIRATIAKASRSLKQSTQRSVDLLLTCTPELARLPWEAWEIGSEVAATGQIRIARVPANIRTELIESTQHPRRRARILVILGQDDKLDFRRDLQTLIDSLKGVEVHSIYLTAGKSAVQLRQEIADALVDPKGWEVLFFAGHSNETALTGGELSLAPNVTIQIKEIAAELSIAQQQGLQFALFNSCEGLSLAESLIDLGISQVAIMREPIHNAVAQEFLIQFLQGLEAYHDVHASLIQACDYLETKKRFTSYPSAYLVPSLFRHPDSTLFRLRPTPRQQLLLKPHEWVVLVALLLLSLLPPIQDWLIGQRMLMQSHFRTVTRQDELPVFPVLLVQVDQDSLDRVGIQNPNPIDREYLARLVTHVSNLGAKVIGIDYFLDQPSPEDETLANAVRSAAQTHETQFVFATYPTGNPDNPHWLMPLPEIANPAWSKPGDVSVFGDEHSEAYLIPFQSEDNKSEDNAPLPFAYELASLYQQQIRSSQQSVHPPFDPPLITQWSWRLGQSWLHPIVDFSLPPDEVFTAIPAWQLLEVSSTASNRATEKLHEQAVMIVPSGYAAAGLIPGEDNLHPPAVIQYWRSRQDPPDDRTVLPGSELQAYLSEHFLSNRFITPIPDLWLVGLALILGKGIAIYLTPRIRRCWVAVVWLGGGTALYMLFSFGLYISSAGLLVPIVLPTVMLWTCVLPAILHRPQ